MSESSRSQRESTLEILTPEGIQFSFLLASPAIRSLAWMIDMFCVSALSTLISIVLIFMALISFDLAIALTILAGFVIQIGYGIVLEWYWRGQTVGKRVFGLRVMDVQGLKLQFSQIVVRNLLRFVDMLPVFYLLGGLFAFFSRHGQRLGDLAANTIVTRRSEAFEPNAEKLAGGKFNSMRAYPHLAARLRQKVQPAEVRVAVQALMRRDQIEDLARVELFQELGDHFRSVVEFPAEAVEGITDEQYVRNVVDILLRPKAAEAEPRKETQIPVLS